MSEKKNILNRVVDNIQNPDQQTTQKPAQKPLEFFDSRMFYALMENQRYEELKNTKKRSYIRASEAGDCANLLVFRLRGDTPDFERAASGSRFLPLMAHVGNAIHDFIQKKYNFTGTEVSLESTQHRIHCRVDALIDNQIVVEIKTVSNAELRREKDIFQVAANFICLREHGYNIQAGQLLYIERTLTRMCTYELSAAELTEYADNLVKKIKHVFECLQSGQEASQFLAYNMCRYCEYNHKCSRRKKDAR